MIGSLGVAPNKRIDLLIGLYFRARLQLAAAIAIECRLRKQLAGQAHAGPHLFPIFGLTHVVEENARMIFNPRRTQPHPTAAPGTHGSHVRLIAMLFGERGAVVAYGHGQKMVLNIGKPHTGVATDKTASLKMIARA